MKRTGRVILRILAAIGIATAVLLVAAIVLTSLPSVRQKVLERATTMLSEKLGTRVSISRADISILRGSVMLYDIEIDDQQHRKMLQIEQLSANLRLRPLLSKRIVVEKAEIDGMNALLTKKTESQPANYQFVIDAFKKDKEPAATETEKKKKKKKLSIDVSHTKLNNIHVKYDIYDVRMATADYQTDGNKQLNISIDSLKTAWTAQQKKGKVSCRATVGKLNVAQQGTSYNAELGGLNYITDNHKPRKNAQHPKRGFFDLGHLNIVADMSINIDPTVKDTLKAVITQCKATDKTTGIDLRNLKTQIAYTKGTLKLQNTELQQGDTKLVIANAALQLPNKKEAKPLAYSTGLIKGRVVLKDIARTFAPVLANFNMPLHLNLNMSGNDNGMTFRNIKVINSNKNLQISANGGISHLKEKHLLDIHFNVATLYAKNNITEKIIQQFKVKKLMMRQLRNLGNLHYRGNVQILWRKEKFEGLLRTAAGNLNFNFTLDENNKYVSGRANSTNLALGRVMELEKLGVIDASADFKFDISKARTAAIRKQKGGKLPIGTVNAVVNDCSYHGVHLRNLSADILSDGAEATGNVMKHGRIRDLYFSFSFTDTDDMHKVKITHPGIKFHPLSEKNQQQREERRKQKKLENEQRKLEKQQKKLEKEQQKQQNKKDENPTEKKKKKFLFF